MADEIFQPSPRHTASLGKLWHVGGTAVLAGRSRGLPEWPGDKVSITAAERAWEISSAVDQLTLPGAVFKALSESEPSQGRRG